jgi:hypothetical protein
MRITRFPILIVFAALCMAVIAFAQAPILSAKDAVERPFHISGQISFIPFSDTGVATHFGKFVSYATDETGSAGFYVTANGDVVCWKVVSYDPDTSTVVISFTGGTGRFESATGQFTAPMTLVDLDTLTFDYEGEGTITY